MDCGTVETNCCPEYVEKVALMPSTDVRLTVIHVSLDKGVTEEFLSGV